MTSSMISFKTFAARFNGHCKSVTRLSSSLILPQNITSRQTSLTSGNAHVPPLLRSSTQSSTRHSLLTSRLASLKHRHSTAPSSPLTPGSSKNPIRFNECKHIDELLQIITTNNNINNLTPNATAAVWSSLSKLLTKHDKNAKHRTDLRQLRQDGLRALISHTFKMMERYNPKELTTVTSSMAKITHNSVSAHQKNRTNVYHEALHNTHILLDIDWNPRRNVFRQLAPVISKKLHKFDARCLANVAYSYALMGYNPRPDEENTSLFDGIADQAMRTECMGQFTMQELASVVWSFATCGVLHPILFESVGSSIVDGRNLSECNAQNLANILWAYAKVDIRHPPLFEAIRDHITEYYQDLSSFHAQAFANIVWAYAKSNTKHSALFQKIGDSMTASNDYLSYRTQALVTIAWSYAKLEEDAPMIFNDAFVKELTDRSGHLNEKDRVQLFQWHLWRTKNSNAGLPHALYRMCYDAYVKRKRDEK